MTFFETDVHILLAQDNAQKETKICGGQYNQVIIIPSGIIPKQIQ